MGKSDKDKLGRKAKDASKKRGGKSKKVGVGKGRTPDQVQIVQAKKIAAETSAKSAAKAAKKKSLKPAPTDFVAALRVADGFVLAEVDPESSPGFGGNKDAAAALMPELATAVGELQERLYAESRVDGQRSVLLIVQGLDTSGKGGIMRHVVGAVDPQGVEITAFKAPTEEERAHPFLWRIRNAVPGPGVIGVFDRSQYEDVLIVRVHDLVPASQWARRYAQINAFETELAASGTTIVKVMLHLSKDEQKARLAERLDRADKHWKYNPGDVDERGHWDEYMTAYQAVLDKCSTDTAPWFVVPANQKWYAQLAVMNLLLAALQGLDPQWPVADFDVEAEKGRLAAT